MQIQVNTDSSIKGGQAMTAQVGATVEAALSRFSDRITRVEVHVTDESGSEKSTPDDKRCVMEARLAGLKPVSVSHRAPTVDLAVDGASEKLEKLIGRTLERLGGARDRTSAAGDQTI